MLLLLSKHLRIMSTFTFPAAYLFALLYFPPRFPVLASSFVITFTDNPEAGTAGPESADVVEAGSDASDAALASTASDAAKRLLSLTK